ncbi:MAG: hypothetical protein JNL58_32375 [Planctomyces sp.]|nr:hypothetical protein [Planctomyces sp.]
MGIIEDMRTSPDFARGQADADADIQAGILGQRAYGKLAPWWEDAARLLKVRYGIKSEIVGSCITEMAVAAAADGYNERMAEEVLVRFGSDVVAATWREVERKVKKRGAGYTRSDEPGDARERRCSSS